MVQCPLSSSGLTTWLEEPAFQSTSSLRSRKTKRVFRRLSGIKTQMEIISSELEDQNQLCLSLQQITYNKIYGISMVECVI